MKNYKLYNIGDIVEIIHSHSDDKGKIGKIYEKDNNSHRRLFLVRQKHNGQGVGQSRRLRLRRFRRHVPRRHPLVP